MFLLTRGSLAFVMILVAVLPCAAQIDDEAGLFKRETIEKAKVQIERIHEQTGKQIAVFTVKEVPEGRAKDINLEDAGHRRDLFDRWARERMKDPPVVLPPLAASTVGLLAARLGPGPLLSAAALTPGRTGKFEGVHLLICQEPRHIEITVSKDTEELFGPWYRNHLKGRMIGRFQPDNPDQNWLQSTRNKLRSPNPDAGLLEAIGYLGDKLDYNRPVDQSKFSLGLLVIAGMIGTGGFLNVLRYYLRKKTPADAGVHDADDSGRSIGVLGGGIGAVCGQWIYNRFFGPRPEPLAARAGEGHRDEHTEEAQGPDALPGEDSAHL